MTDSEEVVTWRQLAVVNPSFVQWVVQTHGPRETEEVDAQEYERLICEFRWPAQVSPPCDHCSHWPDDRCHWCSRAAQGWWERHNAYESLLEIFSQSTASPGHLAFLTLTGLRRLGFDVTFLEEE